MSRDATFIGGPPVFGAKPVAAPSRRDIGPLYFHTTSLDATREKTLPLLNLYRQKIEFCRRGRKIRAFYFSKTSDDV